MENGGQEQKGGGQVREKKGKQYKVRYRFLHIDTQAVTVYVPATSVSGGNGERQGFELGG